LTYSIQFEKRAVRELQKLQKSDQRRLVKAIDALSTDPRPHGSKKLRNTAAYRIRVGDYRVIYELEDGLLTIFIIKLGNRRDVYKTK
jgi:mRNA interferase RelE/StbE